MRRDDSLEKILKLGKTQGRRREQEIDNEMVGWHDGLKGELRLFVGSCSVTQSCLTLCDSVDCSTPGFPVLHYLPEFAQTHVH